MSGFARFCRTEYFLGNLLFPIGEERQAKDENEIASHISIYCFVLESYSTAVASQPLVSGSGSLKHLLSRREHHSLSARLWFVLESVCGSQE